MSGDDWEKSMKQFLYVMPAVLICMLYALLAALAGGIIETAEADDDVTAVALRLLAA